MTFNIAEINMPSVTLSIVFLLSVAPLTVGVSKCSNNEFCSAKSRKDECHGAKSSKQKKFKTVAFASFPVGVVSRTSASVDRSFVATLFHRTTFDASKVGRQESRCDATAGKAPVGSS